MTTARKGASGAAVRGVSVGTLAVAVLAVAALLRVHPTWQVHNGIAAAVILLGILLFFHTRPRRTVAGMGNVESIALDEVCFVPMLVMLAPWQAITIVALASVTGSIVLKRQWIKAAFNLGQLTLATVLGILTVWALRVTPDAHPKIDDVVKGMFGALVITAVTALSVRLIVSFASGKRLREELANIPARFLPWTGALTVGGVGALCVGADWISVFLILSLVAFLHTAYAARMRETLARHQSEQVQAAIVSLRSLTNPVRVREDLLVATQTLLGAEVAQIVNEKEPQPDTATSAPLMNDERLLVNGRLGVDQWDDEDRDILTTLAGVAGDVLRSAELITRLRTITNSQSEGVIALDMDTRVTFANPAALHMLGCASDTEILGRQIRDKLTLRHQRIPLDFLGMVRDQITAQDADATLGPPDGDTLDIAYSITPLRADAEHVGAVLVLRDVTERRAFQDELTRRALHDELTGLPNRRLLLERLDHALARTSATGANHGLLFLDLDRFKLVNDSYGHIVGDKLLVQVAGRLLSVLSVADSVARMSGDEFIILVEDAPDLETVTSLADRLLEVLLEPFEVDGHHIFMSASIGVGLAQRDQGRDMVLAAIDAACYAAKASGRNCYRVSTDASVDETRARLDLEISLRRCLDADELVLHYQPIVTADTGDVVGVEALVRWRSPQRGILWPSQFVPVAEETGLIVPIGQWVLEEACRAAQRWSLQHPERAKLSVSVNLSALQFAQQHLTDTVQNSLASSGLPARQLCLEITETVLMSETMNTVSTLEALHDLGVQVAIDDFGTGYSSLSYLKRFAIDVVKLDRTFIVGMVTDQRDVEIARAVLGLSSALGYRTVAEGVETDVQRRMLVELGCPLIQGFLFSRPLPEAGFLEFWNERHGNEPVTPETVAYPQLT